MRIAWIATLGLAACFDTPEFQCVEDAECIRDGEPGRCELAGYCSFADAECPGGRRFAEASAELSEICLAIDSVCKLPITAREAWRLEIPEVAGYRSQADVQYALDDRAALADISYTRVAYCLLLDDTFVYTEFDDFTAGDIADTGVPTNAIFDVPVSNLTVRTNAPGVTPVQNGDGSIELWPNCYGPGASGDYDTDDDITGTTPTSCYGSFQVHDETSVLWAFNQWTGGAIDLGIGSNPGDGDPDHADWTFEDNAGDYDVRTLQAFIIP